MTAAPAASAPAPAAPAHAASAAPPERGPRQLVLLGAGQAHLAVLRTLAARPLAGVQITLVSPHAQLWHAAMVPGFVAGHYRPDDCIVALEPLVQRCGVHWVRASAQSLDAAGHCVQLDDGRTLRYDWLSVNTGATQNRELLEQRIPGAREHGLFVRPLEAFAVLWPQVCVLAAARPLRIAVVGAGATGLELAMAVQYRFPTAAVTLLADTDGPATGYPANARQALVAAVKARRITVLHDTAAAITADTVRLGCGALLASDVTLLATGPQPPRWLATSGLALDSDGFVAVDACLRSTSQPRVFAAGDICATVDAPRPRNGVQALRAGTSLARNLAAAVQGHEATPHRPSARALQILSCGNRWAIGSWGGWTAQGRWVWWLKNWLDRKQVRPQ